MLFRFLPAFLKPSPNLSTFSEKEKSVRKLSDNLFLHFIQVEYDIKWSSGTFLWTDIFPRFNPPVGILKTKRFPLVTGSEKRFISNPRHKITNIYFLECKTPRLTQYSYKYWANLGVPDNMLD